MNDLDIMKRAQSYIESMAKGINPLTGEELPDADIVNNVRISRCLFYVSDVLKKVIDNGGEVQKNSAGKIRNKDKAPFALTDEQSKELEPDRKALSLSKTVSMINALIDDNVMQKLKRGVVSEWLYQRGFLKEITINGRNYLNPTAEGEAAGIYLGNYNTPEGNTVKMCLYSPEAQQFIFDNIDVIADFARGESGDAEE
jgi:hypothetical protein